MFFTQSDLQAVIGDFHLDRMMRYSVFVPRLYNLCMLLGLEAVKIMSRAHSVVNHQDGQGVGNQNPGLRVAAGARSSNIPEPSETGAAYAWIGNNDDIA